jgi:hypothetical protein
LFATPVLFFKVERQLLGVRGGVAMTESFLLFLVPVKLLWTVNVALNTFRELSQGTNFNWFKMLLFPELVTVETRNHSEYQSTRY